MNSLDHPMRKGFMLMEVMVALALSGILLTAILSLQLAVFKRVTFNAHRVSRFVSLQQFFSERLSLPSKTFDADQDGFLLHYEVKEPQTTSFLTRFKGIKIITATGSWEQWDGRKELTFSVLSFKPEPEKPLSVPEGVRK